MSYEDVTRTALQKGFFFKTADSYPNSPAGFMDYGPLGVSMKGKVIDLWRRMLLKHEGMIEVDGAQILPRPVFEASGHLSSFTDPFVKCSKCGSVFRPDKLIEEKTKATVPEKLSDSDYDAQMEKTNVRCLKCGSKLSGTTRFNMMYEVGIGPAKEEAYLRPETCQSIFVDFPLLYKTQRVKLPVGFAQVGKSFRNEIAPRQGLIRMRELNQAEVEVFFNPNKADSLQFEPLLQDRLTFLTQDGAPLDITVSDALRRGIIPSKLAGHYLALTQRFYEAAGLPRSRTRFRVLADADRAFYSKAGYDFEVELSVGWLELVACNYRGDYDLGSHSKVSGTNFEVDDDGEKVLPHVFELSLGIDRTIYAILEASTKSDGERKYMALKPYLAPVKAGVFPLVNKEGLDDMAYKTFTELQEEMDVIYDDSGSIGRRYARADEVGVPYCVTFDFDSLKDGMATLRSRDTKAQERVPIASIREKLSELTAFPPIRE